MPSTLRALYLEILSWIGVKGWGHNRKVFEKWFASKKAFPSQRRRFQIGLSTATCPFNISPPGLSMLHIPNTSYWPAGRWGAGIWSQMQTAVAEKRTGPAWRSKWNLFPLLSWKAQLQQNLRSNHQRAFLWFYYISPLNMASFIRQEITTCPPFYPRLQSSTNQREKETGGSNSTPGADIAQCAALFFS